MDTAAFATMLTAIGRQPCPRLKLVACILFVLAVAATAAAEPNSAILVGYVASNGTALAIANGSTVYHVTMEDSGNVQRMRFWCNGFEAEGGWDVCKWTRPEGPGGCIITESSATCNNSAAGEYTTLTIRRTTVSEGGRCEVEMAGANYRDAGGWSCILLARNAPLFAGVNVRRQSIGGLVTIATAQLSTRVVPGSLVDLVCQVTARTSTAPTVRWIKWPPTGGVGLDGNITQSMLNLTDQGDSIWSLVNRLRFTTASVGGTTERLVCRADLTDDFGQRLILSDEITLATDYAPGEGPGDGARGLASWEVGLAVGLSLVLLLLVLLAVILLCWCFGLTCFRRRRKGGGGLRKKKLQALVCCPAGGKLA